jgi:hypothetical protein
LLISLNSCKKTKKTSMMNLAKNLQPTENFFCHPKTKEFLT